MFQVSFTALLKGVIQNTNSYVKTSKIILRKEKNVNLNLKAFVLREIEDKVHK